MEWMRESDQDILDLIGTSIKLHRIEKSMSQAELSNLSGVSLASIARFETGKGNISLKNLIQIMKALKMIDELKLLFKNPESITRERVRKPPTPQITKNEWIWGED